MPINEIMNHIDDYLRRVINFHLFDAIEGANELEEESIKHILGRHTKILMKYMVKLETKGDKTENRVLILTPVRIYLLTAKVPTKIECHFHYLDINAIESKKPTHFSIATYDRTYSFLTTEDAANNLNVVNADIILTDLAAAIKTIFPTVPLKYIIRKIEIQPPERGILFNDEYRPADARTVGPCGSFSAQYACMCDYHSVPYREEVAWDVDTIYLSHDTRVLNLRDFDHLEPKDLMAIISALEYNTFFRGLKATHTRLSNESLDRILHVLKRSMWLEELHLAALGLRSDFIHKLAVSVITNNSPALRTIDLSHNIIEDKGAIHLAGPIAKVSKGLCKLALAHCGLTAKGVNQMSHSLSLNQSIPNSLTHLDLSGNSLKDDITNLHNFLAQPNVLEHLDLSSTDITLENLFGALLRGCATHLTHLDVSHNSFSTKKGKEIPPSFKQFFTSTLSLKHLNISSCKLPMEALKNLLLGLACNESTAGLFLDLSGNTLGSQGAHVLESCIHGVRVLQGLDISDNNLDAELASVITSISKNSSIRTLHMCRNMASMKPKYIPPVMDALVNMIQKEDFPLTELVLAENKLKNDIHDFINALGSNQSLQKLDISGNFMGDIGARLLAKALQINNKLRTIYMDKNNVTLQGYGDIVYALENNYSMRTLPFPVFDMAPQLKNHAERTDSVMRKLQELLQRNCNGVKRATAQGFRLQQGFLLSSTHQLVDKLVAETQDTISMAKGNVTNAAVLRLIDDAENCKQLMPKLQEAVRSDAHPVELKLTRIVDDLGYAIKSYLEETLETMLRTAVEHCPKTLGSQVVVQDLRKSLAGRLAMPEDFLQNCLLNNAGSEILNKVGEIEQTLAAAISDRATDEVLEALTRYRRGHGIAELPAALLDEPQTPDIVRSRSSHDTEGIILMRPNRGIALPKLGLESPTATPQFPNKRRSVGRKVRPQSVVENLSLGHIPDLLESPSAHRAGTQFSTHIGGAEQQHATASSAAAEGTNTAVAAAAAADDSAVDEGCDSITELPSASFQLQHLVKGRPKRAKTRAPTRALVNVEAANASSAKDIGEGLDHFFRPGSVTPTTLTPLVSPTSEECSSLSYVDSPTMSRDGNGLMTSEETTPILEERKPLRLERQSPLLKSSSWAARSRSTDNLEKFSPVSNRKIQLNNKTRLESGGAEDVTASAVERLLKSAGRDEKTRSPSSDCIKSQSVNNAGGGGSGSGSTENNSVVKTTTNGILRTPIVLQKPRPWSLVSNESKTVAEPTNTKDVIKATEAVKKEDIATSLGQDNGIALTNSALGSNGSGTTAGAPAEKRSVRELAAGLNRMELPKKPKPQALPRSLFATTAALRTSARSSSSSSSSSSSASSSSAPVAKQSDEEQYGGEANETTARSVLRRFNEKLASEPKTEVDKGRGVEAVKESAALLRAQRINDELLQLRKQMNAAKNSDSSQHGNDGSGGGIRRIAGKEISAIFEV